jgi:nucleoside phosphorylase
MGVWARAEFGREQLPETAFLFAGLTPQSLVESITERFERIQFHKHDIFEVFIVQAEDNETLLALQVYGAPQVADLLFALKDGNVRSVVFLGAAYGLDPELRVGDCVIPTKTRCLDGFSAVLGADRYVRPDRSLSDRLRRAMRDTGLRFREGTTVSVPSTFFHADHSRFDPDTLALEIELASFFHVAALTGLRAAAALVISDVKGHSLLDDQSGRHRKTMEVFETLRRL